MTGKTIGGVVAAFSVLLLSGCECRFSPGLLIAPIGSNLPAASPNVKVHWDRPEFLYINAAWYNSGPLAYTIKSDGTLDPPLTRYDIDNNAPPVPGQYETYIAGLTASPDHRSVYFARLESDEPLNRVSRCHVGQHGLLLSKQTLTVGNKLDSLSSMAFIGHEKLLYITYDQYNASRIVPNRKILATYRFGNDGSVEKLPSPPVVAATYTTSAFVANPGISVAYAVTGPSVHFLYVLRPEDHYLDVYHIKPSGTILTPPAMSLLLGYRPGRAVFLFNGHILYVVDADHASLKTYRIEPTGMPVQIPGAAPGTDLALNPKGPLLYAPAPGRRALYSYRVLPDGRLHLLGTTPTHDLCFAPCVDATGRFVYAVGQDPRLNDYVVSQFRITGNGTVTPLQPEEVPAVGCTTLITAQASP